jgi:hypothetical protein
MPLVISKPVSVLPFLRIKQSRKTRQRSAVWHVGPWQYDTGTGRHKVKLTRKVRWESRTRAQRATAKKARAARRAEERAGWDRYFATRDSAAPVPPPTRTTRRPPAPITHAVPVTVCVFCQTPLEGAVCPQCSRSARERTAQQQTDPAAVCGARTRDGGRCQRTGDCPHHSKTARKTGRGTGTGRETR